ncbi:MAG TPA: hypothetical protein PLU87_03695 [Sedimentisphaerales bacterium]|nr:hypothetical protein [Sedimentisphaerales bacterium]HRS10302.1 hypothetical protein [Sedimentisphaerales bacterium]HRV47007.1 hypothetical protein [Sedimentisphaerales bacterium]
MATEAQVRANRLNAQKSTGPWTEAGKAVVSQNAVTHGLLARKTVISGEDPGQFETYRAQLLAELHPRGVLETVLAERIVGLAWRLRRADHLQAEVFDTLLARENTPYAQRCLAHLYFGSQDGPDPRDSALGRIVISDFRCAKVLERLGLYERRIEQGLYRTLDELEKVRQLRSAEPPAELPPEPQPETPAQEPSCETKPICPDDDAEDAPESSTNSDSEAGGLTGPTDGHRLVTVALASRAATSGPNEAGAGLRKADLASERKIRDEKQDVPHDHDPGSCLPDRPVAGVHRPGTVESAA